jgi:hypothetical protein
MNILLKASKIIVLDAVSREESGYIYMNDYENLD